MKSITVFASIMLFSLCLNGQDAPVWEIGTKWTYEYYQWGGNVSFITNEIIDTVTIDNMKLYKVDSQPVDTEIEYFYFEDEKVYSYIEADKYLQLLYDFSNSRDYRINYQPICSINFDYDSFDY